MCVFYTVTSHNQESESCLDKSGNFAKIKQAQCGMRNHMEHQNVHPTFVFYMVKRWFISFFTNHILCGMKTFYDVNKKSTQQRVCSHVIVLTRTNFDLHSCIAGTIHLFFFLWNLSEVNKSKKKRSLANRYQQKMLLALEVLYLRLQINIGPVTTVSTPHLRFLVKTKAFCSQQNGSW